ncbi:hypothetical protein WM23_07595 [Burkholderia ubonensis]|nr:hypothetical protein WM23_07595 [Burkholderia ubonensis]
MRRQPLAQRGDHARALRHALGGLPQHQARVVQPGFAQRQHEDRERVGLVVGQQRQVQRQRAPVPAVGGLGHDRRAAAARQPPQQDHLRRGLVMVEAPLRELLGERGMAVGQAGHRGEPLHPGPQRVGQPGLAEQVAIQRRIDRQLVGLAGLGRLEREQPVVGLTRIWSARRCAALAGNASRHRDCCCTPIAAPNMPVARTGN